LGAKAVASAGWPGADNAGYFGAWVGEYQLDAIDVARHSVAVEIAESQQRALAVDNAVVHAFRAERADDRVFWHGAGIAE
jgi:hypothetical protein